MSEAFEIVPVTAKLLPLVQHLRYRVYVAEKGFPFAGADHVSRRLISEQDGLGESFAMFATDELAGTVQVIPVTPQLAVGELAALGLAEADGMLAEGVVCISKLVTDKRFRGQASLTPLLRATFDAFLNTGSRYAVILAEPMMKDFYASIGFAVDREDMNVPPYGPVLRMVFDMRDARHPAGKTLAGWMFPAAFQR